MKYEVSKLQLISSVGTFNFKANHHSECTAYDAMRCFESNNWEMLGECQYNVFLMWNDGDETVEHFSGMNATANVAAYCTGDFS